METWKSALLFDPNFAHQFIKECQSWLMNKQSMCAKCKLQLCQHLADNQVQNVANVSNNIHQQCHHFNHVANSGEISDKDAFPFQNLNSKELINMQNMLLTKNNLISAKNAQSVRNKQNLINSDSEIF